MIDITMEKNNNPNKNCLSLRVNKLRNFLIVFIILFEYTICALF